MGTGDWKEYIARRKGKEWSCIPERMPYLKETEGLITYQEQFLLDCKTIAGWDIAYADKKVRKNKDIRNDGDLYDKFISDATKSNFDKTTAEMVWNEIMDAVAGGYSFNKSHSASYAVISYQTAWLKYHYPKQFYACLMSGEKTDGDGQSAIANYITECKAKGIEILPPNINESGENFIVKNNGINYRITTIKHVGDSAIKNINELRPIKDFNDFLQRREKRDIKFNVLRNLVKAGCFDFHNENRAELLWINDMENRTKKQIKEGYVCPKYDWNDKVKAEWEKEVLGMYLSSHPMEKYGFKPLNTFNENETALQGGEVNEVKVFKDKNQNEMAFVFIDTLYGNVKVLVFSRTWANKAIQEILQIGNIIMVKGRRSGDAIILNDVEILN